jgi:hypothetical protein
MNSGEELCAVVEEYVLAQPEINAATKAGILDEMEEVRAHLLVGAAIGANMLDRYRTGVRYCLRAALAYPRIVTTYEFWAVLANPIKGLVAPRYRKALQKAMGAGAGEG